MASIHQANDQEKRDRQLWAAYRLILSWPKRKAVNNSSDMPQIDEQEAKDISHSQVGDDNQNRQWEDNESRKES